MINTDIPQSSIDFAKAIAKEAQKAGLSRATVTYKLGFDDCIESGINNEITIYYNGVDGRGRPSISLSIKQELHVSIDIEPTHQLGV